MDGHCGTTAITRAGNENYYGGLIYVIELPDDATSTVNLNYYAKLVKEKSLLRQFIDRTSQFTGAAYRHSDDVSELFQQASQEILSLYQDQESRSYGEVSELVDVEMKRIEEISSCQRKNPGVTSGFVDLDRMLGGLQKTDLIVLAARPAMGKTSLAINIGQNAALLDSIGVVVFSLEMSRSQLVTRMLCTLAMVRTERVRKGRLDADDWERMFDAVEQMKKVSIYIDDSPGLSIAQLALRALRLKQQHPHIGLLVVDYLQLMQADNPRVPREQAIASISRGLKGLAKELDLPVLVLSQLNRSVERREDKRPLLSDLRESGAIEQDADVIMFIYRDDYYNEDSVVPGLAEVIIAKHRNGPTGKVDLVFRGQFTRFDSHESEGL
jgi:replicative DNA helicase